MVNAEICITKSLIKTPSPATILLIIIKKPKAAEPKRAIQIALLKPLKGFLDSLKSLLRTFGSKSDSDLLGLLKKIKYL